MSDHEILEKAIKKAAKNGWSPAGRHMNGPDTAHWVRDWWLSRIIFNHDFAKALWGDKFINPEYRDDRGSKVIAFSQTAWKHHLRQMAIAEDPIKYLGENI